MEQIENDKCCGAAPLFAASAPDSVAESALFSPAPGFFSSAPAPAPIKSRLSSRISSILSKVEPEPGVGARPSPLL